MSNLDQIIRELHEHNAEDPDRQFQAAIALGRIRDAELRTRVVDELIRSLGGKHQALTRAHAAEALGDLADAQAIPALITALKDSYRLVRSYAARALGKMHDPEVAAAIEPLVDRLGNDDFFGARAEAAEALGNIVKLCEEKRQGDPALIEKAKAAVERDDFAKLKQFDDRYRRILNEMNGSIERLIKRSNHFSEEEKRFLEQATVKIRRPGPIL